MATPTAVDGRPRPRPLGLYELANSDGTSLGVGVLRDELKEAVAYGRPASFEPSDEAVDAGEPTQVRWEPATSKSHAEQLFEEHS